MSAAGQRGTSELTCCSNRTSVMLYFYTFYMHVAKFPAVASTRGGPLFGFFTPKSNG